MRFAPCAMRAAVISFKFRNPQSAFGMANFIMDYTSPIEVCQNLGLI
jgi:hypothetical protein